MHREDDLKSEQRLDTAGPWDWSDVATGQGRLQPPESGRGLSPGL